MFCSGHNDGHPARPSRSSLHATTCSRLQRAAPAPTRDYASRTLRPSTSKLSTIAMMTASTGRSFVDAVRRAELPVAYRMTSPSPAPHCPPRPRTRPRGRGRREVLDDQQLERLERRILSRRHDGSRRCVRASLVMMRQRGRGERMRKQRRQRPLRFAPVLRVKLTIASRGANSTSA